ncbi:hypothetical protein EHQ68_17080 [Leptospira congkakensis]|uniref:Lipoprotein n=1 Tax=Leptospira congkakensis TaxID=2484932 RepID=A0A4Z1A880_9LEPT|nr:hypothetical protein [Leptospira congkakensis]TGL85523.1 hypothetical protein EHQ68_17080 [Leptospira congkakensis]TGL92282.1 hypothetical protein EHQ69_08370 [Leptospira congkakensis]TGM00028.1 hypothetical protein EHQ70_00325 [Leptospira congkakensis]
MKIFFYFALSIVLFTSSCKLKLNNPSDPTSQDFFLTNLIRTYLLSDPCLGFQTWKKTYGTGNYKTTGSDLITLSNGDYLVSGITREYIVPGSSTGVTNNFAGSSGITLNTFLMRVSHYNGDILWVDYLGEAVKEVTYKPKLRKYSNGDISVTFIVTGASQPAPLNAKSGINIPSLFVGRIREDGTRVWYTYLDSDSIGEYVVSAMDTSNRLHVFIENVGSHLAFVENPPISNSTLGGGADSDVIHLAVNENGGMIFQRYFTSNGSDFIFGAEANANGLFVTGTTAQGANGTIHPNATFQMPFVMKLSETDGTTIWYQYLGTAAEGNYGADRFLVKDDFIYTIGFGRYTYGSPAEPIVATDGARKHYIISKLNTSGNVLWNSFLGNATEDVMDTTESEPVLLSNSQLLVRMQTTAINGRFNSTPDFTTGIGSGPYTLADVFVNPQTGTFNRFHYSSNATLPAMEQTDMMREVCSGKMVRLNYTRFTTAPPIEATQLSIENVSLP